MKKCYSITLCIPLLMGCLFGTNVLLKVPFLDDISSVLLDKTAVPLWDYSAGEKINAIAMSADGKYLVAASDQNIYWFENSSSTPKMEYITDGKVTRVGISANGDFIVAGSQDSHLYLINRLNSSEVWTFDTESPVTSAVISADGQYLASGSKNGNVFFFNRTSSTPFWNYKANGTVTSLAICEDGTYLVAGTNNNTYYVSESSSSVPLKNETIYGSITSTEISSEGSNVIIGTNNGTLLYLSGLEPYGYDQWFWNERMETVYEDGNIRSTDISSDGKYYICGTKKRINLYHTEEGGSSIFTYFKGVEHVKISGNSQYLAGGCSDGELLFFQRESEYPIWNYFADSSITAMALSSEGNYVVAGSETGTIYLFEKGSYRTSLTTDGIMLVAVISISLILLTVLIVYLRKRKRMA